MKTRTELHSFTPAQINMLLCQAAKMQIIGPLFIGHLGSQAVTHLPDGSIEVRTEVTEGSWSDLGGGK